MKHAVRILVILLWGTLGTAALSFAGPVWQVSYGGPGTQKGFGVAKGRDGVFIVGSTRASQQDDKDAFVAKYDFLGNLVWQDVFGSAGQSEARSVATDSDGSLFVVGRHYYPGAFPLQGDAFIRKYDASGELLDNVSFGRPLQYNATDVAVTSDGVYVCGHKYDASGTPGVFVAQYTSPDSFNWWTDLRTDRRSYAKSIAADESGVYVVGNTSGKLFDDPHLGSSDAFVAKLDSESGSVVWGRQFGTDEHESAQAVTTDPSSRAVYLTGYTTAVGSTDLLVIELDSNGEGKAGNYFGSDKLDAAEGIHIGFTGPVVVGRTAGSLGGANMGKTDAFVTQLDYAYKPWKTYQFGNENTNTAVDVSGNSGGTFYVVGNEYFVDAEGKPAGSDAYLAWFGGMWKVLEGVPEYRWNYGCTPTAAAMLMGYWDRMGYGTLVSDDQTVAPLSSSPQTEDRPRVGHREADTYETGLPNSNHVVDALIASRGHHEAFWAPGLGVGEGANNDPQIRFYDEYDCLADYLGTSQGKTGNGATVDMMEVEGLRAWVEEQTFYKPGEIYIGPNDTKPSFEKLRTEIDGFSPVLLAVSQDGTGGACHSVLAYGYLDLGPADQWFAVRDTYVDGDSNGKNKIVAFVDSHQTEWWKWNTTKDPANPTAYVIQMNAFWPITSSGDPFQRSAECLIRLSDSFDRRQRDGDELELGYQLWDASADQSGQAIIVPSPIDPGELVLQMTSLTGEEISILEEIDIDAEIDLSFDFLFDDPGKVDVYLDATRLGTLISPLSGPGAPGSGEFGTFRQSYDLNSIGVDLSQPHQFRLALSSVGDPTLYLDNLVMTSVPEPGTLWMSLLVALVGLSAWSLRRRGRPASSR